MKQLCSVLSLMLCLAVTSCDQGRPEGPAEDSVLVVFVHWERQGVADIRLQIADTGAEQRTDQAGIARFSLVPGNHAVRAFGLNTGGPVPANGYVEQHIVLERGETARLEFVDCLPCVAAR